MNTTLLNKIRSFRPLLVSLSITLFLVITAQATLRYKVLSYQWCELVDLGFWVLSVLVFIAGALDLGDKWSRYPVLSTLTVTIMGLALVALSRFSSMLYSLLKTSFMVQPIGGGIIDYNSLALASISLIGAFLVLLSTSLNTLFKRPLVFKETTTWKELVSIVMSRLMRTSSKLIYAVIFATGFLVRLYPEIIYWPLPIGWDTLEYIANAKDFASQPRILTSYLWMGGRRNLPLLLTYIAGVSSIIGLDPVYFYKLYPPVIMGLVSLVSAIIAYELSRSKTITLVAGLFTALNPYIIGQTIQWHRHSLGALLLLLYILALHRKNRSLEHRMIVLMLLSASYELGAMISLFASLQEILSSHRYREKLMFVFIFITSLLLLLFYAKIPEQPPVTMTPGGLYVVGNIRYSASATLQYTVTSLLLIAPSIVAIPLLKNTDRSIRAILLFILIMFMQPALTTIAIVEQHRWFALLLIILTPYMLVGFKTLSSKLVIASALVMMLMGTAYVFTERGYRHLDLWKTTSVPWASGFPWRPTPEVVNLTDSSRIAESLYTVKNPVLVSHRVYPELHMYLRNPTNMIAISGEPRLEQAIYFMAKNNVSSIYVVSSRNLTDEFIKIKNDPEDLHAYFKSTYKIETNFSVEDIELSEVYSGGSINLYKIRVYEKTNNTHLYSRTCD